MGKQIKWYPQQVSTDGVPMVDAGIGRPLILRTFEFSINPVTEAKLKEKNITVTKQDLFNQHWPQIRALIWSDGLVANQEVDPRVIVGKTRYRIFILCEPKFRNLVADRPTTLQDVFKKTIKKKG